MAKLVELENFKKFKLFGTGAIVKVTRWTSECQAVGKLFTVWVRLGKVPDCLKHFFGVYELSTTLGPVLEVDMDTIGMEHIRCKLGVRDVQKIPAFTEIPTKELLIFRITFEVERVVQKGWYNSYGNRQLEEEHDRILEEEEEDMHRVAKKNREMLDGKENVSLGSLSLRQYEAEKNARQEAEKMMKVEKDDLSKDMENSGNNSNTGEKIVDKVKILEQMNARQAAKIALDEKRLMDSDMERRNTHIEMHKQHAEMQKQNGILHQLLQQVLDRKNEERMVEEYMNLSEEEQHQNEVALEDGEKAFVKHKDPVDCTASQESVSFADKLPEAYLVGVVKNTISTVEVDTEVDENGKPRRCDRLKDREDMKIADLAKERAEAKDNYGNDSIPDFLDSSNISLLKMTSYIGIDLRCTLDMIDTNVGLMRRLEVARLDMYLSKEKDNMKDKSFYSPGPIDTGDAHLNELLSDGENSEADLEEKYLDKLKHVFSTKRNKDTLSRSIARLRKGIPVNKNSGKTKRGCR